VITSGTASTTALEGSTEAAQFTDMKPSPYSGHGPNAGCQPILGDCPSNVVGITGQNPIESAAGD
jgi:hypothetical protein